MIRRSAATSTWLAAMLLLSACVSTSLIFKRDAAAGLNGSFEIAEAGYPVNWTISGLPIQRGEATVSLDDEVAHDGRQSLRVEVGSTHPSNRVFFQVWSKPSFSARTVVQPGKRYRISFWYRNEGSGLHVRWVTTSGDYYVHYRHRDVLETAEVVGEWQQVEDTIDVEGDEYLLELIFVATEPGVFWCDEVVVAEVESPR